MAVISAALHLGRKEGKVRIIPHIPRLREDNIRKGFLKDEDYTRLASECSRVGLWLRAIFECAFQYGWRLHELTPETRGGTMEGGLRVSQCDFEHKLILLNPGETKNNEAREAPMIGQVEVLLKACCEGKQPNDYAFTRDGKPVLCFAKTWAAVCDRAGVPGLLVHDLRRTGRRNMALAGIEPSTAMRIGGWKTDSVARRYNIQGRDMIEEARRKMEAYRQQQEKATQKDRSQVWHKREPEQCKTESLQ